MIDLTGGDLFEGIDATTITRLAANLGISNHLDLSVSNESGTDAEEPKMPSNACAHCGKPAVDKCDGCLGAPPYEGRDNPTTYYCDGTCQKMHWGKHKGDCKALQERKAILRT